jgi:rubrerythrin
MDARKVLTYALDREREGYAFFSSHAEKAQHASVQGVFQRLATEEQAHIRFIEKLIAGLDNGVPATSDEEASRDTTFFSDRAASEMIEQCTAEAMVPDLPVLRMAFLIERDLSEFYADAAKNSEGETRKAFEKLSVWEFEHERLFKSIHDRVFAEYSGMPWGG